MFEISSKLKESKEQYKIEMKSPEGAKDYSSGVEKRDEVIWGNNWKVEKKKRTKNLGVFAPLREKHD